MPSGLNETNDKFKMCLLPSSLNANTFSSIFPSKMTFSSLHPLLFACHRCPIISVGHLIWSHHRSIAAAAVFGLMSFGFIVLLAARVHNSGQHLIKLYVQAENEISRTWKTRNREWTAEEMRVMERDKKRKRMA